MKFPCRFLTRFALMCLSIPAAGSATAATVSVAGGASASFDLVFHPVNGNETARVGFFRDYVEGVSESALRAALFQEAPAVHSYLAANFIPLGEPAAPVFANNGIAGDLLGTASTVAFREIPSLSGHLSVGGNITGITFTDSAPANTLTAAGLPRSSRLFLLIYGDRDPAQACSLGVFSASGWLVPAGTSEIKGLVLNEVNTPDEAFYGRVDAFGGTTTFHADPMICMPEPGTGVLFSLCGSVAGLSRRRIRGS